MTVSEPGPPPGARRTRGSDAPFEASAALSLAPHQEPRFLLPTGAAVYALAALSMLAGK